MWHARDTKSWWWWWRCWMMISGILVKQCFKAIRIYVCTDTDTDMMSFYSILILSRQYDKIVTKSIVQVRIVSALDESFRLVEIRLQKISYWMWIEMSHIHIRISSARVFANQRTASWLEWDWLVFSLSWIILGVCWGGGAVFENELCYCLVIIEIRNSNKHKTQEKKRLKFGLLSSFF